MIAPSDSNVGKLTHGMESEDEWSDPETFWRFPKPASGL
ncbi:MAG: hypothetical protein QOG77_3625 [Solirubrobacteraceae bacterium]|jgi:hypothetical protein|nr:hypothetical protein [Solirubrobacteraceae bacterium]